MQTLTFSLNCRANEPRDMEWLSCARSLETAPALSYYRASLHRRTISRRPKGHFCILINRVAIAPQWRNIPCTPVRLNLHGGIQWEAIFLSIFKNKIRIQSKKLILLDQGMIISCAFPRVPFGPHGECRYPHIPTRHPSRQRHGS